MEIITDEQPNATDINAAPQRLPYLPWYAGDFLSATRGWSVTARGVYRELLDVQWGMGSVPAEPKRLREMIGATASEWRMAWPLVEGKFPVGTDGLRRNPRLEIHREKARQVSVKRAEAGRRGGQSKAERHSRINGADRA